MNTSRRSLFGFLGIAGAAAAVPTLAAAQSTPEPRTRRYINGKLICRCDAPEFDEVTTESVRYETYPARVHMFKTGTTRPVGFPVNGHSGAHTHTISDGAHQHSFTAPIYRATITHHCIFCGGIEPVPAAA